MRITYAQLHPLAVPMARPIKMAGETLTHAHTLLVRLVAEDGREGWGEASAAPLMTGETLASIAASTEYLASKMVGREIATPAAIVPLQDAILYGNPSARSCIETALMDLFAQRAGVPLYQLLAAGSGTAPGPRLEMLHMLASGDLAQELEEAKQLRAEGYRQWKIKVGAGSVATDLERVQRISEALRGDVVSADANQAFSVEAAQAIAAAGARSGLTFLEQPFRAEMIDEMAALHRSTGLALCADESIHGLQDIGEHRAVDAAQGASLKLIKLGGTQALLQAGRLCLGHGMQVNLACKVAETTISAAATAHAGFALGQVAWGLSMSNRYLEADVCERPLAPRGGAVHIDQFAAPGLGFAPAPDRLRAFASHSLPVREHRA